MTLEKLREEATDLRKRLHSVEIRLTLAQAWVGLLTYAYEALLYHGVNYRTLKEYTEDNTLDEAADMPLSAARNKIIHYLGRLQSAIGAAVRRKGFVVH